MRTVTQCYRFKLYHSKKNRHLHEAVDIAASVWNYSIAVHRRYYRLFGKHLSANQLMKHITKLKKTKRYSFWNRLGSQAIQDVVQRIDRSYKAFFDHVKEKRSGRKSPPGFKKRRNYTSFTLKQAGYKFHEENTVTLLGRKYKYWKSRPIEGTIKTVTVKRDRAGDFYLCVVTKRDVNDVLPRAGKAAGMDFGLKHFLTLDGGRTIESPEWYKTSLKELRRAHRRLSRCQKGSKGRERARQDLDRLYRRISARRKDWFFKLAHELVGEYAVICIEDLNLDAMKRLWGRKVSDLAFAEFVGVLEWVASSTGTEVVKIDRWAPSTKACHVCGMVNTAISLDDREWDCPSCRSHLDRDINAAINIRSLGLAKLGHSAA